MRGLALLFLLPLFASRLLGAEPERVLLKGELRQWHCVTVELHGPSASETEAALNPFLHYRFEVVFTHASGAPSYTVPGYFAADGDAANSGAKSGEIWRAHFAPDRVGAWTYRVRFAEGENAAIERGGKATVRPPP